METTFGRTCDIDFPAAFQYKFNNGLTISD